MRVYLLIREITSRDGARTMIVVGKALLDQGKASKRSMDMNKNPRLKEAARIMDVTVRHFVMEVEVEE